MKISDLFYPGSIALNSAPQDKAAALEALVQQHQAAGNLEDIDRYRQDILAREAQGTTAVGNGVAIPHAKSGAVRRPGLAAMTDEDLAAVLTYVRREWDHAAEPITVEDIARVRRNTKSRKLPWTERELLKMD